MRNVRRGGVVLLDIVLRDTGEICVIYKILTFVAQHRSMARL